jgi:hypothetical protein
MVRGLNPCGVEIFRACPDRPCGPHSLLYSGYQVFPRGKERPGRDADPSPPSSVIGHERVELYLYSYFGLYGLYRASVPVEGWTLPLPSVMTNASSCVQWDFGLLCGWCIYIIIWSCFKCHFILWLEWSLSLLTTCSAYVLWFYFTKFDRIGKLKISFSGSNSQPGYQNFVI